MFRRFVLGLTCLAALTMAACERGAERDFKTAEIEAKNGNWRTALGRFEAVMKVDPTSDNGIKAARESARISFYEIKDYERSLQYLRHLVLYSPDPIETVSAQKQSINIYFEQLQNYAKAIEETLSLLQIEKDPKERLAWRLKLARAYFHLNDFFQASAEVSDLLKKPEASQYEFELKLLKANILMATKKTTEATALLKELMQKWPDQANLENVPMTLAVSYEEMRDFKAAVDVLQAVKAHHPVPEYIELRIKRLQDRQANQPGARGWRK